MPRRVWTHTGLGFFAANPSRNANTSLHTTRVSRPDAPERTNEKGAVVDESATAPTASLDARAAQALGDTLSYHTGMYGALALSFSALVSNCYEQTRPVEGVLDVSSSFRAFSVAILVFLALDETKVYADGRLQKHRWSLIRVVASALLLVVCNLLATRQAVADTRFVEAIYLVVTLLLLILPNQLYRSNQPVIFAPTAAADASADDAAAAPKGITSVEHAKDVVVSFHNVDITVVSNFALLAYIGARLLRDGVRMCYDVLNQATHPDFGFEHGDHTTRPLCVACTGWASASTAVCGACLFFGSSCTLFVLNNRRTDVSNVLLQIRSVWSILFLAIGIQAAGLVSSFMAMADCVANTPYVYDHVDCAIGHSSAQQARCPLQLVEFRRLGLVQHSLATNVFGFISILVLSMRIEQDGVIMRGEMGVLVRPGIITAAVLVGVLTLARILVAEWKTDWYIELSFAVVLVGTVLAAVPMRMPIASITIYMGLLIDYVYYCYTEDHCRTFEYLTNASNAVMGILFVVVIMIDATFSRCCASTGLMRIGRATAGVLAWSGLSIALFLALLVTAALAAYDGSNVDEVIVRLGQLFNAGLGEQQSVIRFLLWHYAPLIAWASLRKSMVMGHQQIVHDYYELATPVERALGDEAGLYPWHSRMVLLKGPYVSLLRLASWVIGIAFPIVAWVVYLGTSSIHNDAPAAYPMSQISVMVVTVLPPWLLLSI